MKQKSMKKHGTIGNGLKKEKIYMVKKSKRNVVREMILVFNNRGKKETNRKTIFYSISNLFDEFVDA